MCRCTEILKQHIERHHRVGSFWQCPICRNIHKSKDRMVAHIHMCKLAIGDICDVEHFLQNYAHTIKHNFRGFLSTEQLLQINEISKVKGSDLLELIRPAWREYIQRGNFIEHFKRDYALIQWSRKPANRTMIQHYGRVSVIEKQKILMSPLVDQHALDSFLDYLASRDFHFEHPDPLDDTISDINKCPHCSAVRDSTRLNTTVFLLQHVQQPHPFKCPYVCGQRFMSPESLDLHVSNSHRFRPTCRICKMKLYTSGTRSQRHEAARHWI